jgi:hypothetical protein
VGSHPYQADHLGELLDELLAYFRTRGRFGALASALASQLQELEESLQELRDERTLDVAAGAQLDQYGLLVGEPRGGLTDAEYRRFIDARLLANTSGGDVDRILDIIRIVTQTLDVDVRYRLIGSGPAYTLEIVRLGHLTGERLARVLGLLDAISPAGTAYRFVEGIHPAMSDGPFRFDSGPGFDRGFLSTLLH